MPVVVTTSNEVTAIDLISRAMRLLGVYAVGETISPDEGETGLRALNSLVDSLANTNLLIYLKSTDAIPLTANQVSYSIGPTGTDFVTPRPVEVMQSSNVTYQGVTYPLAKWYKQDYNSISIKTIGGTPGVLYTEMSYPNITAYLWPIPGVAGMTLNLVSNKTITSFPYLTTPVLLPPGWEKMLAFLLAEDLSAEFQVPVPQEVLKQASTIRKNIKRTNKQVPLMAMPYGIPANNTWVDWRSN